MPTMDEYAKQPLADRLTRLGRTADELAAALRSQSDAALSRRPDAKSWAAREVVCHLRDTEELFMTRFAQVMAMD
ncbi:MAG: DinB family protein [Candidatus Rokubacteria bacterium]|nr:DinB family protein [Candidatus Rokubacteria bacterium]